MARLLVCDDESSLREMLGVLLRRSGYAVDLAPDVKSALAALTAAAEPYDAVLTDLALPDGTGKEMVARALHQLSDRAARPFVTVNCGAIPETLIESELFGHEKGAFTGATTRHEGLLRAAEGGTLFLDEIGELPPAMQVKLLRALQERKVRPVGGPREIDVDTRVVAATNRDLEKEVSEGRFRSDLFYRLNVIRIHLPPLRERPEDVPALADHFLRKHADMQGKKLRFSPAALRWIASHEYPGNVRELENVLERAVTLALGSEITLDDLPGEPGRAGGATSSATVELGPGFDVDRWLGELEKSVLLRALEQTKGNQTAAARLLGTTFRSFRYRLRKYGMAEGEAGDDD